MSTSVEIGEIAMILLSFRDQLKIYHWQTSVYSRHKVVDELVDEMTKQMDKFIETLQGSRSIIMKIPKKHPFVRFENHNHDSIIAIMNEFKRWLDEGLPNILKPIDKDLMSIRDEIYGSVNRTLYLFSLQ